MLPVIYRIAPFLSWESAQTWPLASRSILMMSPATPPQRPPAFVLTPNDRAGVILVVVALTMTLVVLSSIIRIYMRFGINKAWRHDDTVLMVATVSKSTHSCGLYAPAHDSSAYVGRLRCSIRLQDGRAVLGAWKISRSDRIYQSHVHSEGNQAPRNLASCTSC